MAYIQTAITRFDFETLSTAQQRAERKKLRRLRTVRRLIHFIGFLTYWAILLSITYLVMLIAGIVTLYLS